jgi:prepilin-type N-terminal cleavage/methylation domain-containing protein
MRNERGFSLIEMMAVIFVVVIISAIAVSRLYTGSSEVGGAERLLEEASARIVERRSEAVRLNGDDRRSLLVNFSAAPLPIDFSNLSSTASLKTEGVDDNRDCYDDYTQAKLTCLTIRGNRAEWDLSFNQDELKLPDGWQVFQPGNKAKILPLIGDGLNGRGVLATAIGFDATGKALAKEAGSNEWVKVPTGAVQSETPSSDYSPFWAIYFVVSSSGGIRQNNEIKAAVAVAVHPSGLVERFRYDDGEWIGFQNRAVNKNRPNRAISK